MDVSDESSKLCRYLDHQRAAEASDMPLATMHKIVHLWANAIDVASRVARVSQEVLAPS